MGSARASRAGDGALAIANLVFILDLSLWASIWELFGEGAEKDRRGACAPQSLVAKSDSTCARRQRGTGRGKSQFGMPDRVPSYFQTGWRLFKSRVRAFVISMLLLFLSWVVLEIAVIFLHRLGLAVWLVLHLAWLFLFAGMIVGLHLMALKSVDGEIPRMGDLFGSLERGPAYLLALGIYCLAVTVGLVLLIVPGIYLAIRCCLFAQVITDTSASALAALRKAAALQ